MYLGIHYMYTYKVYMLQWVREISDFAESLVSTRIA